MLTPEQERYLAEFANKGLAEEQEIATRNAEVAINMKVQQAREAKLAELTAQAEALVTDGLQEFEQNEAPKIT